MGSVMGLVGLILQSWKAGILFRAAHSMSSCWIHSCAPVSVMNRSSDALDAAD